LGLAFPHPKAGPIFCLLIVEQGPFLLHWPAILKGGEGTVRNSHHLRRVGAGNHDGERPAKLILGKFCPAGLQSCVRGGSGLRPPRTRGYCVGAINALTFLSPTECIEIPDELTFLQILLVIIRFIEAHPQRMDDAFVGLAFEALLESVAMPQDPGPTALIATPGNERAGHRRPFLLMVSVEAAAAEASSLDQLSFENQKDLRALVFSVTCNRQGAFAAKQLNQPQPHRRLLLLSLAPNRSGNSHLRTRRAVSKS